MLIWITTQLSQIMFNYSLVGYTADFVRITGFVELLAEIATIIVFIGFIVKEYIASNHEDKN